MKRYLAVFAIPVLAALALAPVGSAVASDKWLAALANADGGTTYIATGQPALVRMTIQCTIPSCYKTATSGSGAADCTKDYKLAPQAQFTGASTGAFVYTDGGIGSAPLVLGATTQSFNQSGADQMFAREFDMGADTVVLAKALDAGDPGCRLLQVTQNPNSLR